MNVQAISQLSNLLPAAGGSGASPPPELAPGEQDARGIDQDKLKDAFNQFVGETFFTQLIKSMRSSLGKPAYFHGGRAEEVFQGQLDQMLSERMAETSSEQIAKPMYELFQLQRR
jgi:Rod binding domain-containing protein